MTQEHQVGEKFKSKYPLAKRKIATITHVNTNHIFPTGPGLMYYLAYEDGSWVMHTPKEFNHLVKIKP